MSRVTRAVGEQVRWHAAHVGLRQVDLAQLLGVTQAQVSRKMSGAHGFTVDDLYLLADVFGCQVVRSAPAGGLEPPTCRFACFVPICG